MKTLLINCLGVYIWLYFSIFCHEMGHFIAGKIFDFSPHLVKIGTGFIILRKSVFNTIFEFRVFPDGGYTATSSFPLNKIKLKTILFFLCGPLVHFWFLIILTLIHKFRFVDNLLILILFILEFNSLVCNLMPMPMPPSEKNIATDGKQILDAFLTNYEQIFQHYFFQCHQALVRYEKNQDNIPKILFNNNLSSLQIFIKAEVELQQKKFDEAIKLLSQLLTTKLANVEKVYILDCLASIVIIYGEKKYLKEANNWSKIAMNLQSNSQTIQGTRGAILIEMGKYQEGKEMLLPLTQSKNEIIDITISSCYLAKAEYSLGNREQAVIWLQKVKKNNVFYEVFTRIQQEIGIFV